jgi:uncharacterized protein (TIGR02596 family)
LLVVLGIIAIIIAMVAPVTIQVVQANRLTSCAANLANQINAARMLSIRLNQPVEFRFYRYTDRETPGSAPAYRSYQVWVNGSPYQGIVTFEPGIVLSTNVSGGSWSSILDPATNLRGTNQPLPVHFEIPRATDNTSARYSFFQFRPNGSTNLSSSNQWTLTMLMEKDAARTELPANFVSEVIDPLTGAVRTLRPE